MSPPLKSAQPGIAPGRKRRSPAGGAKKNTSCRVGRIRRADDVGKELGKPRAERENEAVGADALARRKLDFFELARHVPRAAARALHDRCRRRWTNRSTSVSTERRAISAPNPGS